MKPPCRPLKHAPGSSGPSPGRRSCSSARRKRPVTSADTLRYEYDVLHRPVKAIDPHEDTDPTNNPVWQTLSNAAYEVIATIDPLGNQTTIAYTLTGMVAAVTDPLGRTTRYRYNARDWRTAIILPDGDSDPNNNPEITFGYDEEGNLISLTDADGNTTQWRLDAVDRVIEEINALGLSRFFEHDAAGQLTAVVDRNGRRREFDYDLDGRRTAAKWLDGQGQIVFQINYTWDAANQLIGVSDPNQTYTLAYDDAGRIISLDNTGSPSIYPVIQLTNTYDDAANRIRLTDNYGTELRYEYDSLSRMTQADLMEWQLRAALAPHAFRPVQVDNLSEEGKDHLDDTLHALLYAQESTPADHAHPVGV